MAQEKSHIISAIVSNESGVLTRISGLFARRCYNIDSLAVCATEDPACSRMTIVVRGDENVLRQIILQLGKLPDCKITGELSANNSVLRELLLVKINAPAEKIAQIETVARTYEAKIVDLSPDSIVLELTGKPSKIDGFIEVLKPYGILELSRTGLTALERGGGKLNNTETSQTE
ncbi:MAG: acetolactate synthase small subunit [Clostridiales bacterium]|nr:acetolactate synthase small subunit [Clostridiales bacterium]